MKQDKAADIVPDLAESADPAISQNTKELPASTKPNRFLAIFFGLIKKLMYVVVFIGLAKFFSILSVVHGKEIPEDYFSGGYPTILGLMNSEFFMGLIFMVTLTIFAYVLYLLWQLHEIAVHKAEKMASQQAQIVFALSLCGLFIDKTWWVLAIIIAFTRWDLIGHGISQVINAGVNGTSSKVEEQEGEK